MGERFCPTPAESAILNHLEAIACRLEVGNETRGRVLAALERIETQQAADSVRLEGLLVITQAMQDAADSIGQTLQEIKNQLEVLINSGGGEGATQDEVLSLLSPLASAAQSILDRLNEVVPPPGPTALRRGPIVRR